MSNDQKDKKYDLEERTAKFGEDIIEFAKKVPKNVITLPLITQLIKAGTSVWSNYCEADCAESCKDFEHKITARFALRRLLLIEVLISQNRYL